MPVNEETYKSLKNELDSKQITLVAVSKLQSPEDIRGLYELGQRDFGENYVQELLTKKNILPADIQWHFIGHLQSNKAKQLVGHVQLIQGVDSLKLLKEIDRQACKKGIVQDCLLQVHIAKEETKFGLDENELAEITRELFNGASVEFKGVRVRGLMGMASLTADNAEVESEFDHLHHLFNELRKKGIAHFDTLSMGMSGDFQAAIPRGTTMVRIGSLLFGTRR